MHFILLIIIIRGFYSSDPCFYFILKQNFSLFHTLKRLKILISNLKTTKPSYGQFFRLPTVCPHNYEIVCVPQSFALIYNLTDANDINEE